MASINLDVKGFRMETFSRPLSPSLWQQSCRSGTITFFIQGIFCMTSTIGYYMILLTIGIYWSINFAPLGKTSAHFSTISNGLWETEIQRISKKWKILKNDENRELQTRRTMLVINRNQGSSCCKSIQKHRWDVRTVHQPNSGHMHWFQPHDLPLHTTFFFKENFNL